MNDDDGDATDMRDNKRRRFSVAFKTKVAMDVTSDLFPANGTAEK